MHSMHSMHSIHSIRGIHSIHIVRATCNNAHARTQITSAAAAAAMHKDIGLAHGLTDVALALNTVG